MKTRAILLFAMLSICMAARADVVSQEKARVVAENFLHVEGTRAAGGLTMAWDGSDAGTRAGESPLFYLFTNPAGGWVIVSGDESTAPVLGYSYHGTFGPVDRMPLNLKDHFDGLKDYIRKQRSSGLKAVPAEWAAAMAKTRADDTIPAGKLLVTAKYDQYAPYGSLLPLLDNGKVAYTGCCTTAMVIIMKYHNWPTKGTGTVGDYTSSAHAYAPSITLDDHEYDWNHMLNVYTKGKYTEVQANAVATLMRDVAFAGKVNFDYNGSGGLMPNFVHAAWKHFHYAPAKRAEHYLYTDEEWFRIIKEDIDNGLPINYADNHSRVIDGYDTKGNVHFNYGWSGSSDGYYNITGQGAEMCVHIRPDDGTPNDSFVILLNEEGIINKDNVSFTKDVPFDLSLKNIGSLGFESKEIQFVFAHMDRDGNLKELVSKPKTLNATYTTYVPFARISCVCKEEIYVGDNVQVLYREGKNDSYPWKKVLYQIASSSTSCHALPLTPEPLDFTVAMAYDKTADCFTFTTAPDVGFAILDSNGNEMPSDCFSINEGTIKVFGDKLAGGEYTVKFSATTYVDSKELRIRVN